MDCRKCGACCIAPSISSSIPGMPDGKPAGERCVHLTVDYLCELYGRQTRPRVCSDFPPAGDTCGASREEALALIARMEKETAPGAPGD